MPDERIGSRQNAEDNHETREEKAGNAQAAVNVHAAGGDQRRLRDEQENPAGKCRPMRVNDSGWAAARGTLRRDSRCAQSPRKRLPG